MKNNAQGIPTGKRRSCLGCLGRGALGFLVLLVLGMAVGAIYQTTASASDAKKYPMPGELYNIGDYRLHLYCTGEGSPTVILESGGTSPGLVWHIVQEDVPKFTRVCSYDRAGFGWSEPASKPLSAADVATDLYKLLAAANIPGPYVMVGHSIGGAYVRAFIQQYPSDVVGMVLVDSSHESQNLRFLPENKNSSDQKLMVYKACQFLSPFGIVRITQLWNKMLPPSITSTEEGKETLSLMYQSFFCEAAAKEEISSIEMLSQSDGPASLGNLPLIVLTAYTSKEKMLESIPESIQNMAGGSEWLIQMYETGLEMQKDLVALSSQGKQILVENSSHYIYLDQPGVVIDSIRSIVEQVRGG